MKQNLTLCLSSDRRKAVLNLYIDSFVDHLVPSYPLKATNDTSREKLFFFSKHPVITWELPLSLLTQGLKTGKKKEKKATLNYKQVKSDVLTT